MHDPRPATISSLSCTACGRVDDLARGWRMYVVTETIPWTVTCCPECAEREMGENER